MPRIRWASRSGWNGSRPSVRSPVPMKLIGSPVTLRMLSAAPPRASPSILVSTRPVIGRRWWNASATVTASWPVMASTTSSVSAGVTAPVMRTSSSIIGSSTCRRPAVSSRTTSCPRCRAASRPDRATSSAGVPTGSGVDLDADLVAELHELIDGGGPVDVGGHQQRPVALLAQPDRQLGGGGRLARSLQPDQHDHGRLGARASSWWRSPPSTSTSSSCTILTTCWPG